ncbi:MAG: hypothetical protein ACI4GA_04800 [Acutalibacteraceae bacterium]|nr:hypothetical protein [Oscillospiraceae bacterium]
MENIKITGSDDKCQITGENFSYTFENGHPTVIIRDGERQPDIPFPLIGGKHAKSKTKLVHKYWDSALVVTKYTRGVKSIEVKYHILSNGEMKSENLW